MDPMIFMGGTEVDEVAVLFEIKGPPSAGAGGNVLMYKKGVSGVKRIRVFDDGGVEINMEGEAKVIRGVPMMLTKFGSKKKAK